MTVGIDSWATVAFADSYVDGKYGEATWPPLPSTNKEKLLITAFRKLSATFGIAASATAENIKQAQVEMALFILHYFKDIEKRGALQAMGVKSFNIAGFSESYGSGESFLVPPIVEALLGSSGVKVITAISRPLDE
jgi:hypothetical protein